MTYHAVVWLDHRAAKIIAFNMRDNERAVQQVHDHAPARIHHKAGTMGSGHVQEDPSYFREIADKLQAFQEVLVLGPAEARTALMNYVRRQYPKLALHILGSETCAPESEGEIVETARQFFRHADRMTPQT